MREPADAQSDERARGYGVRRTEWSKDECRRRKISSNRAAALEATRNLPKFTVLGEYGGTLRLQVNPKPHVQGEVL